MIKKDRIVGSVKNMIDDRLAKLPVAERGDKSTLEKLAFDVADTAILLHREKIAAALRRSGMDVSDTQDITVDVILDLVNKKTGLDLRSFDGADFKDKVLEGLSTDISARIGIQINLKLPFQEAIDTAVDDAIKSGRVSELVTRGANAALARISLARRAGIDKDLVQKIQSAKKQSLYRKTAGSTTWVLR